MKNKFEHWVTCVLRIITRKIVSNTKLASFLVRHNLSLYLPIFYYSWLSVWPNVKHPQNIDDALLNLSIEMNKNKFQRDFVVKCADKYAVREYIQENGYGNTLNELYGVYDNADDINFDSLPNQFVIKMNNACGRNFICTDKSKIDRNAVIKQFNEWLKDKTFGISSGEWQYSLIKPQIIIEKYLANLNEKSLIDYKFHVFGGKVYSCLVAYDRIGEDVCLTDYTPKWVMTTNILPEFCENKRYINKPLNLDKMIAMAENLCRNQKYVRFDVYEIDGKIIFGEMTFTPHACVLNYYTDEWKLKAYQDNKVIFNS